MHDLEGLYKLRDGRKHMTDSGIAQIGACGKASDSSDTCRLYFHTCTARGPPTGCGRPCSVEPSCDPDSSPEHGGDECGDGTEWF